MDVSVRVPSSSDASALMRGSVRVTCEPPTAPSRALVAIDDEALRRECCEQISRLGLQVVEATSPTDASGLTMSHGADLAVLALDGGIVAASEIIRLTVFGVGPALVVTPNGRAAELPLGLRSRAVVHAVGQHRSNEKWARALNRVWEDWAGFLHLWRERGSALEALRLRGSLSD